MTQRIAIVFLILTMAPSAYAGKFELTTYYPAPTGEYASLSASTSFIPPKMTTTQRDVITTTSNPKLTPGMVIFNTDTGKLEVYVNNATGWSSGGGGGAVYSVANNSNWNVWSSNQVLETGIDVAGMTNTMNLNAGNYLIEFSAANAFITSTDNGNTVITRWLAYPEVDIFIGSPAAGYTSVCSEALGLDNHGSFPLTLRCLTNITAAGSYTVKVQATLTANSYCDNRLYLNGSKVLSVTETK